MNPRNYPNIILDLGGVILNINYHLTIRAFEDLGMIDFQTHFTQLWQQQLFDQHEMGLIDSAAFRNGLRPHLRHAVSDDEIDTAWNAMLLDLPASRLALLKELKQGHRLFLLSNTNSIHIAAFEQILQAQHGVRDLSSYFERVYYSYQMGMRKPDPAIFSRVIEENGLNPSETVFIDDSPQHVAGAREAGITAIHLHNMELTELFDQTKSLKPNHLS